MTEPKSAGKAVWGKAEKEVGTGEGIGERDTRDGFRGGKDDGGNFLNSFLDCSSEAPSWIAVLGDNPGWKDWNENPLKGILWNVEVSTGRLEVDDSCCGFGDTTVVGCAERGWNEKLAEVRGVALDRKVVTTGRGEVTTG